MAFSMMSRWSGYPKPEWDRLKWKKGENHITTPNVYSMSGQEAETVAALAGEPTGRVLIGDSTGNP